MSPPKLAARPRLLGGMIDSVARDGYAQTSVERVLAYAGASRSTFYENFADKDECFLAVADEIGEQLLVTATERATSEDPQRLALGVAEVLLGFALEEEAQARLVFTELLAGGERALHLRDALIDSLAALIEAAWRRGAGQTPTHDLPARALVGGIFRLLSLRMRHGLSGLHELQPAVLSWIETHSRQDGLSCWQSTGTLEALPVYPGAPVEPLMPPRLLPRGRRVWPADERARHFRDRLLHAAAASVYEKGYAHVSVADIVKNAGVSRSVFYEQFRDKQSAVSEATKLTFDMGTVAVERAFFATTPWPAQSWAGARALTDFCAAAPALTYLAYIESYAAGPSAIDYAGGRMRDYTVFLESGYHQRPEVSTLSRVTSEIIACATFELIYREQPHQFARLLPQLAYLNLAPFLGANTATTYVHSRMSELGRQATR